MRRILDGCCERFGDTYRVQRHKRLNPLVAAPKPVRFPEDVRPGDACVVFSKRDVHAAAAELHEAGRSCCVVYGALPHTVRRAEARRFREGDAEVVVATDAIGMGLNLPIKRVVFLRHEKYDGRGTARDHARRGQADSRARRALRICRGRRGGFGRGRILHRGRPGSAGSPRPPRDAAVPPCAPGRRRTGVGPVRRLVERPCARPVPLRRLFGGGHTRRAGRTGHRRQGDRLRVRDPALQGGRRARARPVGSHPARARGGRAAPRLRQRAGRTTTSMPCRSYTTGSTS